MTVEYAVTGVKDGETHQQVDYGKLTPVLTAALQEALATIDQQKAQLHDALASIKQQAARIHALEMDVDVLKSRWT